MSTRRMARVASMIREVVSDAILKELRDPRIRNVTVLGAQVSPDLRHASVSVSVMGDEKVAALSMHGLNSARGYLQSKVADYIKSRYTPELRFVLDDGISKAAKANAILRELQHDGEISGDEVSREDCEVMEDEPDNDDYDSFTAGDMTAEHNSDHDH